MVLRPCVYLGPINKSRTGQHGLGPAKGLWTAWGSQRLGTCDPRGFFRKQWGWCMCAYLISHRNTFDSSISCEPNINVYIYILHACILCVNGYHSDRNRSELMVIHRHRAFWIKKTQLFGQRGIASSPTAEY